MVRGLGEGPSRKLGVLGKASLASLYLCPFLRWYLFCSHLQLKFAAGVPWYCWVDSVTSILSSLGPSGWCTLQALIQRLPVPPPPPNLISANSSLRFSCLGSYPVVLHGKRAGENHTARLPSVWWECSSFLTLQGFPLALGLPVQSLKLGVSARELSELLSAWSPLSHAYCLSRANLEPYLLTCSFLFSCCIFVPKQTSLPHIFKLKYFCYNCRAAHLTTHLLCLVGRLCEPGPQIWFW